MKRPDSPTLALSVGALGSAAANTAWTWTAGPVRIAAGLFTTALVPVAMHLWPRVPVTGRITRVLRFLVMGYICAAAAVVNLAHAVLLLTDHRNERAEHLALAVLSITAIEALMVMASLARRKPAVPVSRDAAPPRPAPPAVTVPPVPQATAASSPVGHHSPAAVPLAAAVEPDCPAAEAPSQPAATEAVPVSHDEDTAGNGAAAAAPEPECDVEEEATAEDAVPGVPSRPKEQRDPVHDAVRWAVREQRAGRDPGWRAVQERFPQVSKRDALKAAKDARERVASRLHAVGYTDDAA